MSSIEGHCLCGGVTFEYDGEVGPANYCHCEDCRRCTGGPFNIGVRLVHSQFRITKGQPRGFTKAGDSGRYPDEFRMYVEREILGSESEADLQPE